MAVARGTGCHAAASVTVRTTGSVGASLITAPNRRAVSSFIPPRRRIRFEQFTNLADVGRRGGKPPGTRVVQPIGSACGGQRLVPPTRPAGGVPTGSTGDSAHPGAGPRIHLANLLPASDTCRTMLTASDPAATATRRPARSPADNPYRRVACVAARRMGSGGGWTNSSFALPHRMPETLSGPGIPARRLRRGAPVWCNSTTQFACPAFALGRPAGSGALLGEWAARSHDRAHFQH